jgi:hypothetical protein
VNFKSVIMAFALLLVSCGPSQSSDGYYFESVDMPNTHRQITIITHPSLIDFSNEIQKRHIKRDGEVFGFSVINPIKNSCEVHIVDPALRYKPEELGHEITHCLYGNFHRTQQ